MVTMVAFVGCLPLGLLIINKQIREVVQIANIQRIENILTVYLEAF